jgi:Rad3-related DNA helicase
MVESVVEELFPFPSFRGKQHKVIEAIIKAFYDEGYQNVVLDAPTGTGKSPILTTVLRYADSGYYTTPLKSLSQQLENDEELNKYIERLKARRDYSCKITGENCEECSIYQSKDQSCSKQGQNCTYWARLNTVMNSPIALITFSRMIVDGNIPEEVNGVQVSFGDREVLAIDEAQDLCQQVEEMHAGFKVSPYNLPTAVFNGAIDSASYDAFMYKDVEDEVNTVLRRCKEYVGATPAMEMSPEQKSCKQTADKIEWMQKDVENDNPWVVDVDSTKYGGGYEKTIQFIPVDTSSFLYNFVWERGEKTIISTATLPYRDNPDIWLRKVGLDPEETKVISVPMPFPVKNRPIHTDKMVASMSNGGFKKNLDSVLETMNEIASQHHNQKGLVHTSSYDRANLIADSINEDDHQYLYDNLYVHNRDRDTDVQIEEWQESDFDMMLSPSMTEGVDLVDDMCRYQILAKVPYPGRNPRTKYVLENEDWGWMEYYERTLIRVVQSYGRAVRNREDYADYYVLDEDFDKLLKKRKAPDWFIEAIDAVDPVATGSIFDF